MKKKEKSGWKEKSAETGKKLQNFVTERSLWQQDITFKERGAAGGKAAALIGITAWLYYRKIWVVPALIPLGLWLYREFLKEEEKKKKLESEVIDITLPGKKNVIGKRHPLELTIERIKDIFISMGFSVEEGPEVELDYYNFEALNIPKNHPARSEQDTFYINDNVVLRTQTSGVQIRVMEKQKPPIKMISPGKVYRADSVDATHSPIFHQMEGLVVAKGVTFADLKGTLELFVKKMFGDKVQTKFRPHHFPFTEPSAEMDATCFVCGGKGCNVCKGSGWIEMLGCGMVHPNVLRNCGIDPEEYSGFAFGFGIDRMVMLSYGLDDIRLLYESDMRFLNQF